MLYVFCTIYIGNAIISKQAASFGYQEKDEIEKHLLMGVEIGAVVFTIPLVNSSTEPMPSTMRIKTPLKDHCSGDFRPISLLST